jgi:hypothetical protein
MTAAAMASSSGSRSSRATNERSVLSEEIGRYCRDASDE